MLEPAKTVIEICGGITKTAKMVKRSETRVRRWAYPREKGGSNGLIPSECQVELMRSAKAEKIDLLPEHFFPADVLSEPGG